MTLVWPIAKNRPLVRDLTLEHESVTDKVDEVFRAYMATAYINGQNINDENILRAMAASAVKMAAHVASIPLQDANEIVSRRVEAVLRHGNRAQSVLNWQCA